MSAADGTRYEHILVGLDGQPDGERALEHAGALAARLGARVTVVVAIEADREVAFWFTMDGAVACDVDGWLAEATAAAQEEVDAACARLRAADLRVRGEHYLRGRLREIVAERAAWLGADLIVLAAPRRRGLVGLLPSWPDAPPEAPCPVLLVGARRRSIT